MKKKIIHYFIVKVRSLNEASVQSDTPPLVSAPKLSSPAPPRPRINVWCDEVWTGAGRSVVRTAALHGGAVHIRIGWVEIALVEILNLRHIVAKSVSPAQS